MQEITTAAAMADETRLSTSLRPRGFFAFTFLFARIIVILALNALAGLTVHFFISILRAKLGGGIPGGLIGLIILVSRALPYFYNSLSKKIGDDD